MDCLITVATRGPRRIVSVAGRLTAAEVGDLLEACARQQNQALTIDLSELMSIDVPARNQLLRLRTEGAQLIAVPPYLQLLLQTRATSRR